MLLDRFTWSDRQRKVLVGGRPLRILRLTDEGAALAKKIFEDVGSGSSSGTDPSPNDLEDHLRGLLSRAQIAHPLPLPEHQPRSTVGIVIPVYQDLEGCRTTLSRLPRVRPEGTRVTVIDDGSNDRLSDHPIIQEYLKQLNGSLLRLEENKGPAAARNFAWRSMDEELIAFLDSGCMPPPGWIARCTAYFNDPRVGAVASRVVQPIFTDRGREYRDGEWGSRNRLLSWLQRSLIAHDSVRSPLDMGVWPAVVARNGQVPYVPAAAVVVRRKALVDVGGFDESLRFGEDVDLFWRLGDRGWVVRYDPSSEVIHPVRKGVRSFVRQRFNYGTSAPSLDNKHPWSVSPVSLSPRDACLVAIGISRSLLWWVGGTLTAIVWIALRLPRLSSAPRGVKSSKNTLHSLIPDSVLDPKWWLSTRWTLTSQFSALGMLSRACTREWWPVTLVASLFSTKLRRMCIGAIALRYSANWFAQLPPQGMTGFSVACLLEDIAYGSGVWWSCLRERSFRSILPVIKVDGGITGEVVARVKQQFGKIVAQS